MIHLHHIFFRVLVIIVVANSTFASMHGAVAKIVSGIRSSAMGKRLLGEQKQQSDKSTAGIFGKTPKQTNLAEESQALLKPHTTTPPEPADAPTSQPATKWIPAQPTSAAAQQPPATAPTSPPASKWISAKPASADAEFDKIKSRTTAARKKAEDERADSQGGLFKRGAQIKEEQKAAQAASAYGAPASSSTYAPISIGSSRYAPSASSPYGSSQESLYSHTGAAKSAYESEAPPAQRLQALKKMSSSTIQEHRAQTFGQKPAPDDQPPTPPQKPSKRELKAQKAQEKEQEIMTKRVAEIEKALTTGDTKTLAKYDAKAKDLGMSRDKYLAGLKSGELHTTARADLRDQAMRDRGMLYNLTVGDLRRDTKRFTDFVKNPTKAIKEDWARSTAGWAQAKGGLKQAEEDWKRSKTELKLTARNIVSSFEKFKQSSTNQKIMNAKDQAAIKAKEIALNAKYANDPQAAKKVKGELEAYKQDVLGKRALSNLENQSIVAKRREIKNSLAAQAQKNYDAIENSMTKKHAELEKLGTPKEGEAAFVTVKRKQIEDELVVQQKQLRKFDPESPDMKQKIIALEQKAVKDLSLNLKQGRAEALKTSTDLKKLMAEKATATPERKAAIDKEIGVKAAKFESLTNPSFKMPQLPAPPATPVPPVPPVHATITPPTRPTSPLPALPTPATIAPEASAIQPPKPGESVKPLATQAPIALAPLPLPLTSSAPTPALNPGTQQLQNLPNMPQDQQKAGVQELAAIRAKAKAEAEGTPVAEPEAKKKPSLLELIAQNAGAGAGAMSQPQQSQQQIGSTPEGFNIQGLNINITQVAPVGAGAYQPTAGTNTRQPTAVARPTSAQQPPTQSSVSLLAVPQGPPPAYTVAKEAAQQ